MNKMEGSISEEEILKERKNKIVSLFLKKGWWVIAILAIAIILGLYIRSLPMKDHGGHPGLWDITTNNWTLGPDLDPFLFLRDAQEIVQNGHMPSMDFMRNVPLGFDNSEETRLLPYMIVFLYKIIKSFNPAITIEYAAVLFPVIMFGLTIIVFFLFVREIFKDSIGKNKANIIALISTFFMVVVPDLLSRTIAGIPEKESAGFFFMFLAFYIFLKGWKAKNLKSAIILGIIAGISTAMMGLVWGGVSYVFVTVAAASLIAFILNKVDKKEFSVYSSWIITSLIFLLLLTHKFQLKEFITSLDSGLALIVFFIMMVHFIVWKTKISELKILKNIKLPKPIISLIMGIILLIIISLATLGPSTISGKINDLNNILIHPVTGRWGQTVAENRQPYFTEWQNSFGPLIKNIPILFWLLFIGSAALFRNTIKHIGKKESWILTGFYILFFLGIVFSRYSQTSIFNGENFISKLFYYGSALLLVISIIYVYIKNYKNNKESFEKIDYNLFFIFVLLVLCLFTARSAVRLIMVLAPIAPIFLSYLVVGSVSKFKKIKDETGKIVLVILILLLIILSIFTFYSFYSAVKVQAYNYVPSYYTFQWQEAMSWTRTNTPSTAVFAHWWDYGYWVQTMGKRATVTDGGNAIVYWNYLTGRLVLTGDNQKDALEFLYTHNTTNLLIDSSDIGKYSAYSLIGSDANFDRYSWIPTLLSNPSDTQETKNSTIRVFKSSSYIDEDIIYKNNDNSSIFLPAQRAALLGIFLEYSQNNNTISFNHPLGVFYDGNGNQIKIPLRYLYQNNKFIDYGSGINATFFVMPNIYQTSQGIQKDELGAGMYLSPRVMRGLFAQLYLLNDPFHNFGAFELAHSEPSVIIDSLNSQGAKLNDFIFFGDVQGPIKIWNIKYTGDEKVNPEYLIKTPPPSITWKF